MKHVKIVFLLLLVGILTTHFFNQINLNILSEVFIKNESWGYLIILFISAIIIGYGKKMLAVNYLIWRLESLSIFAGFLLSAIYFFQKSNIEWIKFYSVPLIILPVTLIAALLVLLVFRNIKYIQHHTKKPPSPLGFIYEKPIEQNEKKEDGYKRKSFASKLIENLNNTDLSYGSFAVGIVGEWGSGKTSVMNLMKENLNQNNTIFFDFNPWRSENKNNITQDFFDALRSELNTRSSAAFESKITLYSRKLLGQESFYTTILNFVSPHQTIDELYDEINNSIDELKSKIYVFVDDLDRLDKNEILSVFKLIRNTANFKNMIFVLGYDRKYVSKTIHGQDIENYLKKIFQLIINLPTTDQSFINKHLHEKTQKYNVLDSKGIDFKFENPEILSLIRNVRDINHIFNSFFFIYQSLKKEVLIYDLFLLEMLRYFCPEMYLRLSRKNLSYVIQSNNEGNFVYYLDKDDNFKNEHGIAQKILTTLFNPVSRHDEFAGTDSEKSLIYPVFFDRYFFYKLTDSNISSAEFNNMRLSSSEKFKKSIDHWLKNNKHINDIISHFQAVGNNFQSESDHLFTLEADVYFLQQLTKLKSTLTENKQQIITNISNHIKFNTDTYEKNKYLQTSIKKFETIFVNYKDFVFLDLFKNLIYTLATRQSYDNIKLVISNKFVENHTLTIIKKNLQTPDCISLFQDISDIIYSIKNSKTGNFSSLPLEIKRILLKEKPHTLLEFFVYDSNKDDFLIKFLFETNTSFLEDLENFKESGNNKNWLRKHYSSHIF